MHADVFAELSAAATIAVPEPASTEPERSAVLVEDAPMPHYEQATDTAALMRELSSLGMDDDAPPRPPTRPGSQQPRPVSQPKKRKGLFGR
ncbi:MAG: hypothetical protein H0X59_06660 [Chloroflexi bacterium]|nr:hypothetical protein [Chloroflexota bacterium]